MNNDMAAQGFYDRTAEHVAVLIPAAWRGLGPALLDVLAGVDVGAGPVVDVGAGSGVGTAVLARGLPRAEIIAVEPHPALRTALLARVAANDDLAARVTVLDTDVLSAVLPDQVSVFVMMNVIGHFSPAQRHALWAMMGERLTGGGRAVLNLHPPLRPEVVEPAPMAEVVLGRRRYTGSASAEPAGPDSVTWRMSYRVVEEGRVVTEFTASGHWYVFTPDRLADELADHGLQVTPGDAEQGLSVISR